MAEAQHIITDEVVSQFLAVTGSADVDRATSYLEMSGGNLETAVGLFMEHTSAVNTTTNNNNNEAASPQVRAPDQTQSMRLMDAPGGGAGGGMMAGYNPLMGALMQANADDDLQVMASAFSRAVDPRAAVNAAAAAAAMEQEEEEEESKQPAEPGLDDLFAPPTNLMFQGGFQGARAVAKDAKRWLLVNIQQDASFASHALNRDVWRNDLVENLVREGFILFQTFDTTPEGRTYCERYQVHMFPHIAIIDARTGRLLWRKEGWTMESPFSAEDFAEMAMDVCSRHSLDKPPSAKKPKKEENEQVVLYSSEEEEEEKEEPSFLETLLATTVAPEPAAGGARIQIRMPNAKRLVRKFDPADTLKSIYAFVAQSNDEVKGGKEFTLTAFYPPRDLLDEFEKTVEECGLSGEAITVRWK